MVPVMFIRKAKKSQFDGSLSIDSFASTFLMYGAALLLFVAIVFALANFQDHSRDEVQRYSREAKADRPTTQTDFVGPGPGASAEPR